MLLDFGQGYYCKVISNWGSLHIVKYQRAVGELDISWWIGILSLITWLQNDKNEVKLQHNWGIFISEEFALVSINTYNYVELCQFWEYDPEPTITNNYGRFMTRVAVRIKLHAKIWQWGTHSTDLWLSRPHWQANSAINFWDCHSQPYYESSTYTEG